MLTIYMPQNNYCAVCQAQKVLEIERTKNDGGLSYKETAIEYSSYFLSPETERLLRVFCPECGIIYHENSV